MNPVIVYRHDHKATSHTTNRTFIACTGGHGLFGTNVGNRGTQQTARTDDI